MCSPLQILNSVMRIEEGSWDTYWCYPLWNIVHKRHNLDRRKCGGVNRSIEEFHTFEKGLRIGTIVRGCTLSIHEARHYGAGRTHNVGVYVLRDSG